MPYFEAYREIAETIREGLERCEWVATLSSNRLEPERTNILLGFHVLDPAHLEGLPADTILYNFEQIADRQLKPIFHAVGSKFVVWDYSPRNIAAWNRIGSERTVHVPVGWVPGQTRIDSVAAPDIDVLFYGLIEPPRRAVLDALRSRGLRVCALRGVYGSRRDEAIARAQIVLNLHLYETRIFEIVRVAYLLANSKAVVAECDDSTEIEPDIRAAVCAARYADLVNACVDLVRNDAARQILERRGFEIISARDESVFLRCAVETSETM